MDDVFAGNSFRIDVNVSSLQLTVTARALDEQLHEVGHAAFDRRTAAITQVVNRTL